MICEKCREVFSDEPDYKPLAAELAERLSCLKYGGTAFLIPHKWPNKDSVEEVLAKYRKSVGEKVER